jgi:YHS domain-containing protein
MNLSRRFVLALSFAGIIASVGWSRAAENATPIPNRRVALRGYDPVAYFRDDRPEKGVAEFSADFDDATYWFRNAEHRDLFVTDPDRYAPQYSGFCAVSISLAQMLEPDPESWAISDGKLYVFSKQGAPLFQQQTAAVVSKANENWRGLHYTR